MLVFEPKYELS